MNLTVFTVTTMHKRVILSLVKIQTTGAVFQNTR